MMNTDRLRPKLGPLEIWRIGASFLFLGFGVYFIVTFVIGLFRTWHRPWTQLLLGVLLLLYGAWRLYSGWRNLQRRRAAEQTTNESE